MKGDYTLGGGVDGRTVALPRTGPASQREHSGPVSSVFVKRADCNTIGATMSAMLRPALSSGIRKTMLGGSPEEDDETADPYIHDA